MPACRAIVFSAALGVGLAVLASACAHSTGPSWPPPLVPALAQPAPLSFELRHAQSEISMDASDTLSTYTLSGTTLTWEGTISGRTEGTCRASVTLTPTQIARLDAALREADLDRSWLFDGPDLSTAACKEGEFTGVWDTIDAAAWRSGAEASSTHMAGATSICQGADPSISIANDDRWHRATAFEKELSALFAGETATCTATGLSLDPRSWP
jgi:hypothetical protein